MIRVESNSFTTNITSYWKQCYNFILVNYSYKLTFYYTELLYSFYRWALKTSISSQSLGSALLPAFIKYAGIRIIKFMLSKRLSSWLSVKNKKTMLWIKFGYLQASRIQTSLHINNPSWTDKLPLFGINLFI